MELETLRDLYISELKDLYSAETQLVKALPKMAKAANNAQLKAGFEQHLRETEQQIARLEELMHGMGTDRSVLKDWATSIMGNLAAIGHSIMPDEILKNTFANHAFENFEIASYTSLIAMAEATGNSGHVPTLRQTLTEEERMATWIRENTPTISLRYLQLKEQGEKADR